MLCVDVRVTCPGPCSPKSRGSSSSLWPSTASCQRWPLLLQRHQRLRPARTVPLPPQVGTWVQALRVPTVPSPQLAGTVPAPLPPTLPVHHLLATPLAQVALRHPQGTPVVEGAVLGTPL